MICGITELRKKEVINIRNGFRLGFVSDVEIDVCNARIISIIIYGKLKFFGLLGRNQDIVIKWENVDVVGEEVLFDIIYELLIGIGFGIVIDQIAHPCEL